MKIYTVKFNIQRIAVFFIIQIELIDCFVQQLSGKTFLTEILLVQIFTTVLPIYFYCPKCYYPNVNA